LLAAEIDFIVPLWLLYTKISIIHVRGFGLDVTASRWCYRFSVEKFLYLRVTMSVCFRMNLQKR